MSGFFRLRRKMQRFVIPAAALLLIPVLLSGCSDAQRKEYKELTRRLEHVRVTANFESIKDGDYQELLAGFEAMPGYRDADALAEEARAYFYDRALSYLTGSSPEHYYSASCYELVTDFAERIGDFRDIAQWKGLNEAAHLMTEGRAREAAEALTSLPEELRQVPLGQAIQIGGKCAEGDWIGALDQLEAYGALLTAEAVSAQDPSLRGETLKKLLNSRQETLSCILSSPGLGIAYVKPSAKIYDDRDRKKAYQDCRGAILDSYYRQAYEEGLDLRTLASYPCDFGDGLPAFISEDLAERTERLCQALTEMDLWELYGTGTPLSPVPVTGGGICIILRSSRSGEVTVNKGREAEEIRTALPRRSAWAKDLASLRYLCRIHEQYTATHEVTIYDTKTGETRRSYEYDIHSTFTVYDTATGTPLRTFSYKTSQHNHTSTRDMVLEDQILPALQELLDASAGG